MAVPCPVFSGTARLRSEKVFGSSYGYRTVLGEPYSLDGK